MRRTDSHGVLLPLGEVGQGSSGYGAASAVEGDELDGDELDASNDGRLCGCVTWGCCWKIALTLILFGVFLVLTMTGDTIKFLDAVNDMPDTASVPVLMGLLLWSTFPCGYGYGIFEAAAGYVLGWWALALCICSGVVGCCLVLPLNRRILCADMGEDQLINGLPNEKVKLMVRAVISGVRGPNALLIVTATRPSPLVLGLQNLIFSVANPPFWSIYVPGTVMGLIPDAFIFTYIGTMARRAQGSLSGVIDETTSGGTGTLVMGIELGAAILLVVIQVIVVRRAFREEFERLEAADAANAAIDDAASVCTVVSECEVVAASPGIVRYAGGMQDSPDAFSPRTTLMMRKQSGVMPETSI